VANVYSNNVSAFTINPSTGALTEIAGSPFAAGMMPRSVVVDPSGKFAYVVSTGV
jgi:6-phosphogluconolactonase